MKKLSRSSIIINGTITPVNTNYYMEKGFLIADSLFQPKELEEISEEVIEIFRGNRGRIEGIKKQPENASDEKILRQYNAIHFPHKISPVILRYVRHTRIARILKTIVSSNVKCMQSMFFVKGPGKPGQSWHQDEFYIPTRDRSLTGVWIALDDATIDNGCLWVIPGSQRDGIVRRILPFENQEYREQFACDLSPYIDEDALPVQITRGSVIFFNGYLLHRSLKNKTEDRYRRALVAHYMSAESMLPWNWDGRIELKEDMRDIVMISGKDPYAYKGIDNITYPYLRSEDKSYTDQAPRTKKK